MPEAVYWVALAVGAGFLFLSAIGADILDWIDVDLGDGASVTGVAAGAVGGMGLGGLVALALTGSVAVSIAGSIVGALSSGAGSWAGFRALARAQNEPAFRLDEMVGSTGRCTVAVIAGQQGQVSVHHKGMARSFPARSSQHVGVGEGVIVEGVLGGVLMVRKAV